MMFMRRVREAVIRSLRRFPVVGLVGSRQTGKTTLARSITGGRGGQPVYLDLEKPSDLSRLSDAESYLASVTGRLAVLDEIQRLPEVFPLLRSLVDERRVPGRFLILGSASPALLRQSSESLAGRIRYHELGPLNLGEVPGSQAVRLWLRGGYPLSFTASSAPASLEWRQAFIATHLERDMPQLGVRIPSGQLRRFWEMLAHSQGQLWNGVKIAAGLGVTAPVVRRYLDVLQETFMVRELEPWSLNVKKRLVKAPKIYVRDSGLVHALLGLGTLDQVLAHPVAGGSWEGWAIEQVLAGASDGVRPYFYRTHAGAEVDLVLVRGDRPVAAIEFKRSRSPEATRGLREAMKDLGLKQSWVIYPGSERFSLGGGVTAMPVGRLERSWLPG